MTWLLIAVLCCAALEVARSTNRSREDVRAEEPYGAVSGVFVVDDVVDDAIRPRSILRVVSARALALPGEARAPAVDSRVEVNGVVAGVGSIVSAAGIIEAPPMFATPLEQLDVAFGREPASLRTAAVRVIDESTLGRAALRIRAVVRDAIVRSLPAESAGVVRALVLGDGRALSTRARDVSAATGLAHVLAVSGLHVTIICGTIVAVLAWLLRRAAWLTTRVPARRVALACGIPLALAYAALAGGEPSAWRSAIAAALAWSLELLDRRPSALAVTAASAIALAFVFPADFGRVGSWLSFVTTFAVLERRTLSNGWWSRGAALARATFRATLAAFPITWVAFGAVPVVGVAANLALAPIGSVVLLPLALFHSVAALLGVGRVTALITDAFVRTYLGASSAIADCVPPCGLPPPTAAEIAAASIATFSLLASRSSVGRTVSSVALVVAIGVVASEERRIDRSRGETRVTFLDVGQGDATVIEVDRHVMVIDTGGMWRRRNAARRALVPYLRGRRITHVDMLVLTHPHPDHAGGLVPLLDAVAVREIWDNGQAEAEGTYEEVRFAIASARKNGVRVRGPPDLCGAAQRLGRAVIEVCSPCPTFDAGWNENDNSLVLRIAIDERTFVLLGDAERAGEQRLVRAMRRSDVVKVGHHGSRTSSSAELVRALSPSVAIISAGHRNGFGHPRPEVIDRWRAVGARVLTTAEHGTIRFRWAH